MFKENKRKAFTLSYDDGIEQDRRLVEILNKYGLKCTFNLNTGIQNNKSQWTIGDKLIKRLDESEISQLYRTHEIAAHSFTHPDLTGLSDSEMVEEIQKDMDKIKSLFGHTPIGFAYPYGTYDDRTVEILSSRGLKYARTVCSTNNFEPQTDLMRFKPTCHHNEKKLMELAKQFVESDSGEPQLFYVWGHSYEFEVDNSWDDFERFCEYISGRADIFYGTNTEVFNLA